MSKNSKSKKRLATISALTPFCIKECTERINECLKDFKHPLVEPVLNEVVSGKTRLLGGEKITFVSVVGDSRDSSWSKSGMGKLCECLEKTGYYIQGINSAVYSFIPIGVEVE